MAILRSLPFDIYVHILEQLAPSSNSDECISALVSCLEVSSTFRAAASISSLWESHYHARYTICDLAEEQLRKQSTGGDWRLMYLERRRIDKKTLDMLSKIVMERGESRLERARQVNTTFSFDAWNALEIAAGYPSPEIFNKPGIQLRRTIPSHAVPMRFWARMLLGAIARSHAVSIWGKLLSDDTPKALELSFACVSSFFISPPMKVLSQLEELTVLCKAYFIEHEIPLNPAEFASDAGKLRLVCSSICDFLWSCGFEAADEQRFHFLQARLPHLFLDTHKATIPLSLVYVFVCIAQRIGLTAAPVDFPVRVLAIVSSPDPNISDIFVDVFGSRTQAILSFRDDIPRLLDQAGVTPNTMLRYISPASCASMLVRTSRNILASFSIMPASAVSEDVLHTAFYASLVVNLMFTRDNRYLMNIMQHINRFPLDLFPVLVDSLSPFLNLRLQEQLKTRCTAVIEEERETASSVHHRSTLTREVKFFVGMVFRHAAYGYVGYIYGWDPSCMASEEWIHQMGIDSLSRGRHQPFYHALTQSGSLRYVAEENVTATCLETTEMHKIFTEAPMAERYFEDLVQMDGKARFLPSPELSAAYPDDEAFGNKWLTQ